MSDSPDANLQLKKRARRRLVGAFAFAGLAAVILPMVMDEEPKQQVQDVQIRIPGQDSPFANKLAKAAPDAAEPMVPPDVSEPTPASGEAPVKPAETRTSAGSDKATDKPVEKPTDKPAEKSSADKEADKASAKADEKKKVAEKDNGDTKRAAAILDGKAADTAPKSATSAATPGAGQFVILIGAFANPANVKQLQTKIGELGIKVYTEPLDSPGGKKTRVRAGPFANREAADKALERLKRIGVNGVVAAR